MALILRESAQMPFHTDLREVIAALDGAHLRYRWFLTEIDANPLGSALPEEPLPDAGDRWITGERLDEIAKQHEVQLIWGVLSGFFPDALVTDIDDGESHFERFTGLIRHPDAQIEITAFDSSFTAIVARESAIEDAFRAHFPEAREYEAR